MNGFNIELRRHGRFWFTDGSLYLLVEDTLYRVHRYLFELHAKNFPVLKDVEARENGDPSANQKPYVLDDVKQVDFDRLLACLYPSNIGVEEDKSSDDWVSILKLAVKWNFESLRAKAISKVAELANPIDRIVLGRTHDIEELLLPGYIDLCQSKVPLSQEEGRSLGLETVINIYQVRQELWGKPEGAKSIAPDKVLEKVNLYIFGKAPAVANLVDVPPQAEPLCSGECVTTVIASSPPPAPTLNASPRLVVLDGPSLLRKTGKSSRWPLPRRSSSSDSW